MLLNNVNISHDNFPRLLQEHDRGIVLPKYTTLSDSGLLESIQNHFCLSFF